MFTITFIIYFLLASTNFNLKSTPAKLVVVRPQYKVKIVGISPGVVLYLHVDVEAKKGTRVRLSLTGTRHVIMYNYK